jgi:hypothetical protein
MTPRFFAPLLLLALALASCDSTSSSGSSTTHQPSDVVGSWTRPAGSYSTQYFVFRADGTGEALSVAGTRRVVSDFSWKFQGDSMQLTKGGTSAMASLERHGDTLALFCMGLLGPYTVNFVKTTEPDLTPNAGDRPAPAVGHWSRMVPTVSEHSVDNVVVGHDTTWNPELVNISSDGTAMIIGFDSGDSCDADWNCKVVSMPSDTARYQWWTGGSDLYLQLRSTVFVSHPTASNNYGDSGPIQVVGWSASSDSLHLVAKFSPYAMQGYSRLP